MIIESIQVVVYDPEKATSRETMFFRREPTGEPVQQFIEYLLTLGIYSEITLEQKFTTAGIVLNRLKGGK